MNEWRSIDQDPPARYRSNCSMAICFPEIRTAIRVHTFSSHIVTSVA
jgi:hypothetical protein